MPRPRRSDASSLRLTDVPITFGAVSMAVIRYPCGRRDRLDDVVVPRAAAEVPLEALADRGLVGRGAAVDEADRREHHPRRAVAALQRVVIVERLLYGMELAVPREPLDRRDLHAVGLDAEHRARLHRLAVHEHGAGPARGGVAADVRPGETEPLAEHEDEKLPRLELEVVLNAVRGQRHASHRLSFPLAVPRA